VVTTWTTMHNDQGWTLAHRIAVGHQPNSVYVKPQPSSINQ